MPNPMTVAPSLVWALAYLAWVAWQHAGQLSQA